MLLVAEHPCGTNDGQLTCFTTPDQQTPILVHRGRLLRALYGENRKKAGETVGHYIEMPHLKMCPP